MSDTVGQFLAQEVTTQEVYVGPRPFERSERGLFFGRDREVSELLSLVISNRAVLCYAPSGAGKTSLINAGLHPRLEQEGFEVLPSARVRGLIPEGVDQGQLPNLYIFNALLSLAGEEGALPDLAGQALAEFLAAHPHQTDGEGFPAPRILIFDQFEELLTSYPERWQERDAFFRQVHEALRADPLLRVLFVIREDFLARLEPLMDQLKPFQQARFRLALLGLQGANAAITGPLRGTDKCFKEGVADALIEELLQVRVETPQGEAVYVTGEYVEPVQLQVVCRNLWISLPLEVAEISKEHVQAYGDVDQALRGFYESCLEDARKNLGANMQDLRHWFEEQLITPAGTRGIVFRGTRTTADLPNTVVDFLENRHLIRGEWRAGSRWYELTHDRFIRPIQQANEGWRTKRQVHRNNLLVAVAIPVFLALILAAGVFGASQTASSQSEVVEKTVEAAQSTVSVAQEQATAANQNAAASKSRQLAAQSLSVTDQDLALLLAVEANQQADTQEARRSLHTILSTQPVVDGFFLREYNPKIISPQLLKRFQEQENWVTSVAFSPDGHRFLSGSADTTLILWDLATLEPAGPPWRGHTSNILSVDFSPDGTLAASAGLDSQILIWDVFSGTRLSTLSGHTGLITCLAFSPDGKWLASGGEDALVRIWNLNTNQSVALLSYPTAFLSLAWSPDGKTLATGGSNGEITLWNIAANGTVTNAGELTGQPGQIRSLAWSPDGRTLAAGSVTERDDQSAGDVFLWDPNSAKVITHPLREYNQPVREVAFHPSGEFLAVGREDGTITLWDTRNQQIMGQPIKAHNHWVMSIAFSPNGKYMLSGSIDQTIALWDMYAPTTSIAFSPRDNALAFSEGAVISLWDPADTSLSLGTFTGHTDTVLDLEFSPDGSILASAGQDASIRLLDVDTREQIGAPLMGTGQPVFSLSFIPDGKKLASAAQDGTALLWDLEAEQPQGAPLYHHTDGLIKTMFGPDGEELDLGGMDGNLITLSLASGESDVEKLPGLQPGQRISSLAFSPDGQKVAYFPEEPIPAVEDDERAHGIEIASWNLSFDPSVNPDDIDFIIVLATNGNRVDNKFDEYLHSIQVIPIRGATHLYQPDVPWKEQADLFLSTVENKGFHFFTLDVDTNPGEDNINFSSDIQQWLEYVEKQVGQKILLQTTAAFYNTLLAPSGDWVKDWPLLIIAYPNEPDRSGSPILPKGIEDWKIWQYSEDGNGAEYGVGNGRSVTMDVYNGRVTDMWKWLELPTFTIYDRISGEVLNPTVVGQVKDLHGIDFSPDSTYVATGGEHRVSLWNSQLGNEITTLPVIGTKVTSVRFSPDGWNLAVGTESGTVLLWDLSLLDKDTSLQLYIDLACSRATRNFTPTEWDQYFAGEAYHVTCPNLPASQ